MRRFQVIVLAAVMVLASATPALASHGTKPSGMPDNLDHYVDRNNLLSNTEVAVAQGIAQLDRSQLNVTLTGSGDVEVYDGGYGDTGWDGRTSCSNKVASTWLWERKCDVFKIEYNTSVTAHYSDFKLRVIGCHEFGHTGGLGERTAANDDPSTVISCMRDSGFLSTVLDSHDLNVINSWY